MIRWVVRLAIITALLGLLGTVLILYEIHKKNRAAEIITPKTNILLKKDSLKNRPSLNQPAPRDTSSIKDTNTVHASKPVVIEKKVDSTASLPPEAKETEKRLAVPPVVVTPTVKTPLQTKPAKAKKPAKKLFTLKELRGIVKVINRLKQQNKNFANCVQLQITEEEFNRKLLSQTETFLKNKRFTLAGKEVIAKKIKGVKVKITGSCVKITIGTF